MNRSLSTTLYILFVIVVFGIVGFCAHDEMQKQRDFEIANSPVDEGGRTLPIPAFESPTPATHREELPMSPFELYSDTIEPPQKTAVDEANELRTEVERLRTQVRALQAELSLHAGPVSRWLAMVLPAERPEPAIAKIMAEYLQSFPVELRDYEGWWLAERIKRNDWKNWGPTIDEAIFGYLGESRLRNELTPEQFEACKP